MSLAIWTNHDMRPAAQALFVAGLKEAGCRLVRSAASSRSLLSPSGPDPALAEADIAYSQPDPGDVMHYARIQWVAVSTAGYRRYDHEAFRQAMRQRGTLVTNASSVFAPPCAEHVLAQMLAGTRELPKYVLNQAGPRAWDYLEGRYTASLLAEATVLILGFGAIGRRLAELLAPFRCRVIALRRASRGDEAAEIVGEADLPRALALADHVVDILPDAEGTRHFCRAERFALMKRGAAFYNIGRGLTVQHEDLLAALRSGQVGSAWLDALDPEPLPPEHPLWSEPNCHITPHVGGGHRDQDENLVRHFLANLRRFQRGEPLVDRIF
jgi:phosphoglycerate dehydrogenase-like enzyme